MPQFSVLEFKDIRVGKINLMGDSLLLESIEGKGHPLSFQAKARSDWKGRFKADLICSLDEVFYSEMKGVARDAVEKDDGGNPVLHCHLEGDLKRQRLVLADKVVSKVIAIQFRKIGNGFRQLFRGGKSED